MIQTSVHTQMTRACHVQPSPYPFTLVPHSALCTAPGNSHTLNTQGEGRYTNSCCRRNNIRQSWNSKTLLTSQPHLPDLNGPQSGSRNKTKRMVQAMAPALPMRPPHSPICLRAECSFWPKGHLFYLIATKCCILASTRQISSSSAYSHGTVWFPSIPFSNTEPFLLSPVHL